MFYSSLSEDQADNYYLNLIYFVMHLQTNYQNMTFPNGFKIVTEEAVKSQIALLYFDIVKNVSIENTL